MANYRSLSPYRRESRFQSQSSILVSFLFTCFTLLVAGVCHRFTSLVSSLPSLVVILVPLLLLLSDSFIYSATGCRSLDPERSRLPPPILIRMEFFSSSPPIFSIFSSSLDISSYKSSSRADTLSFSLLFSSRPCRFLIRGKNMSQTRSSRSR